MKMFLQIANVEADITASTPQHGLKGSQSADCCSNELHVLCTLASVITESERPSNPWPVRRHIQCSVVGSLCIICIRIPTRLIIDLVAFRERSESMEGVACICMHVHCVMLVNESISLRPSHEPASIIPKALAVSHPGSTRNRTSLTKTRSGGFHCLRCGRNLPARYFFAQMMNVLDRDAEDVAGLHELLMIDAATRDVQDVLIRNGWYLGTFPVDSLEKRCTGATAATAILVARARVLTTRSNINQVYVSVPNSIALADAGADSGGHACVISRTHAQPVSFRDFASALLEVGSEVFSYPQAKRCTQEGAVINILVSHLSAYLHP
ncbi:uncharacterized protein MYCFIDRAFT_172584 [Pseudocercospora fijiensis CIRAD86]|uniref:Uncharacterized protein n=1 Tax=Pseudocercospora fijiensis (strain CIRAD86) TaxID=383855 RepID=M3BCJ5_PSEFD|nr:uncharacterized protein MYCFIDRAFT_172584 [Pseudocercospora fijiensis CIRAD86]EME86888.1 hypothetical protein MYCFIDRAFT_172584 [Pseudocercospora fijiensis CIRAD86]